ncbi:Phospholipase A1-II 1 [Capsicum baccatum]|uniref:Phospholipase A1 n=1 Tax=Capsicum baccatum TaxID=33114 RepID=A0A2G2V4Q4_CAPBA|nr:Phospholipase A1-II 1 [Capsicum baccatum]
MRNWFKRKKKSKAKMDKWQSGALKLLLCTEFEEEPNTMDYSIGKRWKVLCGKNNWDGLMDPLDHDLRRYIIHYGEMAQASYDNFNFNKVSKNAGNNRYSKNDLFAKVGLDIGNPFKYRVTKYFYATSSIEVPEAFIIQSLSRESWCKESNWIGYIAVSTDEGKVALGRREILISWRGTVQTLDWVDDLDFFQVSAPKIFRGNTDPKIHRGWYSIYSSEDPRSPFNKTSARDQVIEEVKRLAEEYKSEEISITITGHSMGAAVGTLNAIDIVVNGFNKGCLVTAFLFASPKVGDSNFKNAFSNLENLRILRVSNALDIVPNYPMIDYSEIGVELVIDTTKSRYLKVPGDVRSWHSLEVHMHGVAGFQGANKCGFKLEVGRDISLVNKHLDALKDEYCVPACWWVEKNNGMVQQDDGSWNLMDHENDDDDD